MPSTTALRVLMQNLVAALPDDVLASVGDTIVDQGLRPCDACDSAAATYVTPNGFYGCDAHPSPERVDLPYAVALRAPRAALGVA